MGERAGTDTVVRHPWNTSFEWADHEPPFRRVTREQAAQFDRDGYVVLNDLVDDATLGEVTRTLDEFEARTEAYLLTRPEGRETIAETDAITFTPHVVSRSPVLRALAASAVMTDLCADLLGPDVNLYWDQAVYKKPEKPRRFPWHQDNGYTFVEPQQYLTVWLALTDADEANGCPVVAPGIHRQGTLAHRYVDPLGFECFEDPPSCVAAPVRSGGAVVFSSLTPHLTGPNNTDAVRKAYILQYAPAGARTLHGDPRHGPPTERRPCDDPARQFPVLRAGEIAA